MKSATTFFKSNIFILFALMFFSSAVLAQNISAQHNEKPDQSTKYEKSKVTYKTSLPFTYASEKIRVSQVNVAANGMNILGDAGNEPSIAFDFTDPNKIAIGWRQFDNINNNFRQAGYGYTTDGGVTWTFPTVIDPRVFRSDPVLDSDSDGNFYYNSLTVVNGNDYVCDVYKSTDGGATWDEGVYAYGGDKQWMVIDRTENPSNGNIYAYWNASYSTCKPNSFTRSVDGGQTFEECSYLSEEPFWGTLAVSKDGDVLICGYDYYEVNNNFRESYYFTKSTTAKYADSVVTFIDPVHVPMHGILPGFGGPNPAGITGQVYIASDHSDGLYSNSIYILATIEDTLNGDPADIYIAASRDGGLTWEDPVRVNDDPSTSAYQWFGTLSVAPNGRIDVVWLDTKNSAGGDFWSELFYSFSVDGGKTWYPSVNLLEESFDPHIGWPQQNKMGDYFDMVSDEEGAHLAWAATYLGEQNVYYARIYTDVINSTNDNEEVPSSFVLEQNYPNPFNPSTTISFAIPADISGSTSLKIYDPLGNEVAELVNENLAPGNYEVNFNCTNLSSGIYFYTLRTGNLFQTKKMTFIK